MTSDYITDTETAVREPRNARSNAKVPQMIFVALLLIICGLYPVRASSLDTLVSSYNFDYSDGTVRAIGINEQLLSQSAANDTLVFNVTTNVSNSSTYYFIINIFENGTTIQNYTNATVSAASPSTSVMFDTRQFTQGTHNYSLEIRDPAFALVYRKYNLATQAYPAFAKGNTATSFADQTFQNGIRVNVTISVTQNTTTNVTIYLGGSGNTLSSTKQATLASPTTTVSIDFDNETIKATHYSGNYTISAIGIGSRTFPANYTTAAYNYATLAQTSYVSNTTMTVVDNNSDNLSDIVQVNVSLVVKTAGNYTVQTGIVDPTNTSIGAMSWTGSLGTGTQNISLNLSGTRMYSSYQTGVFSIPAVTLQSGAITVDTLYLPATSYFSFSDFAPPPLPDLTASITVTYPSATIANITVNVSNIGSAPAFNVFLDLFDNNTYQNESVIAVLTPGQAQILQYTITNESNNSVFAAIVDMKNVVDEQNESNNIAVYPSANSTSDATSMLSIESFTDLTPGNLTKVLELVILNNGTGTLNATGWRIDFGDGTTATATTNVSLQAGERLTVLLQHAYNGSSSVVAIANATSNNLSASQTLSLQFATFNITGVAQSGTNLTEIIEFTIQNGQASGSIDWRVNTSESTIRANTLTSVTAGENVTYFIEYSYTTPGNYTVTITANKSVTDTYSVTLNITVNGSGGGGGGTLPQLLYNYTFTSGNEGFTLNSGWNWNNNSGVLVYNGSDFGGNLFSPNDSLSNWTNGYNITIVFTSGNITNTKLYFTSSCTSLTGDKYNFERQNDTHQHFKHDNVGFSNTSNYADGIQQTILASVNITGNATKACHVGGSCSNSEGLGSNTYGDCLAIAPGSMMGGKQNLNVTTIEIWRTG
jgi:hypothetical protein